MSGNPTIWLSAIILSAADYERFLQFYRDTHRAVHKFAHNVSNRDHRTTENFPVKSSKAAKICRPLFNEESQKQPRIQLGNLRRVFILSIFAGLSLSGRWDRSIGSSGPLPNLKKRVSYRKGTGCYQRPGSATVRRRSFAHKLSMIVVGYLRSSIVEWLQVVRWSAKDSFGIHAPNFKTLRNKKTKQMNFYRSPRGSSW